MAQAYSSAKAGNWSDSTVWTPAGVPTDGDTVTILHAVTMTASVTIGTNPGAAGTPAIEIRNTTTAPAGLGTLTITAGVLTLKGSIRMVSTSNTRQATLTADNVASNQPIEIRFLADTASYRIDHTASGSATQAGHISNINIRGRADNKIIIRSYLTAGGIPTANKAYFLDRGSNYDCDQVIIDHAEFYDMAGNAGDADKAVIEQRNGLVTAIYIAYDRIDFHLSNIRAWRCGCFFHQDAMAHTKLSITIDNVQTWNSVGSMSFRLMSNQALDAGAPRRLSNVYADRGFEFPPSGPLYSGYSFINCVVAKQWARSGAQYNAAATPFPWGEVTNVVFWNNQRGASGNNLRNLHLGSRNVTNLYVVYHTDAATANFTNIQGMANMLKPSAAGGNDVTYDGIIGEQIHDGSPFSGDPNFLAMPDALFTAGMTRSVWTIKNSIIMYRGPDRQRSSGTIFSSNIGGTFGYNVKLIHNTLSYGGPGSASTYYGESQDPTSEWVSEWRSNLYVGNPALTKYSPLNDLSPPGRSIPNWVNPSGITHNGVYSAQITTRYGSSYTWSTVNPAGSSGTVPCVSNGTRYDMPFTSVVPGANDIYDEDPQLRDTSRGFAQFSTYKLGMTAGSIASINGANYTVGTAECTCAVLGQDPVTNIPLLFAWVREGYQPTNEVYRGTAHDGADIGAVAMGAPPPSTAKGRESTLTVAVMLSV